MQTPVGYPLRTIKIRFLMSYFEDCPLPAELPFIPQKDCNFVLGQITRLVVIRTAADLSTIFEDADAVLEKANWEALLSATGDNKGVLVPPLANVVIPQSEATFYGGGDNSTVNGLAVYTGHDNVTVTAEIHNTPPAIIEAIQPLSAESNGGFGYPRVGVVFFTADGQIAYRETPEQAVRPIPFYNFVVSSPGSEGYKAPTISNLTFTLESYWYKGLKVVTPNFDIRELVNVESVTP